MTMDGYSYNGAYAASTLDQHNDGSAESIMMMMAQDGMHGGMAGLGGGGATSGGSGQSLDDIVNQNAKMMRRQSMPHGFGSSPHHVNPDMRRISMMDYGEASPASGISNNYHYDPSPRFDPSSLAPEGIPPAINQQIQLSQPQPQRESTADLSLDTGFVGTPQQTYSSLMPSNAVFSTSPAQHPGAMDVTMDNSPYIDANLGMNMDYSADQSLSIPQAPMQMNLYNQRQFNQTTLSSPVHPPTQAVPPQPRRLSSHDVSIGSGQSSLYGNQSGTSPASTARGVSVSHSLHVLDHMSPATNQSPMGPPQLSGTDRSPLSGRPSQQHNGFATQSQHAGPSPMHDISANHPQDSTNGGPPVKYKPTNQNFPWDAPDGGWPSSASGRPHMASAYKNAYSSTGFDMLGVLMRVATRPNPEINIGAVDLSCAFVVCDAEKDDFPIVYISENFERLTGYTKHMILGRNCRFLQSPDGNVAPGVKRKYVDDDSVLYLKNMINLRREAQISLINYRRGGQPFMNLLTMIPITWDTEHVKFFVGFQVDLVEQPNAVTNKNPDGSYSINYQRGMTMPRYVLNAPDPSSKTDLGQTVPRDDVSAILSTISSGESEYAKRMWDKVLLENTDDVVHVLSLKGLFQWVSPSALRVLEYEPSEIIGTALSSVCHPSDIVPVTRELKDTSTGASVNVVFRIRRKNSGYMWFEGHGSLHTEQGKGRKSIIMVGRERPVYALNKDDISSCGGIGENELWTKMSTSGMFLFISSNVRQLLDRQPDELVGVSIQSLMRAESKTEFGRILEHARTGKKASVKHEMINRRGQVLSAFTTLYPGDATEGQKPTFIVAQTRLIKFSRGNLSVGRPQIYSKESSESIQSPTRQNPPVPSNGAGGDNTPDSNITGLSGAGPHYTNTAESATTYAGQQGLVIGHQDVTLASEDNLFDELKTTKSSSWQYEIRQLEKRNRVLAEEVQTLIAAKKKRKRRKGAGNQQKDCANCHTRVTPEWRRGPSGQRDLCNSCGLRWAKLNGRVSPRTSSQQSGHSAASDKASKASASPKASVAVANAQSVPMNEAELSKEEKTSRQQHNSDETREKANHHLKRNPDGQRLGDSSHAANMEGASGVPDKIDEGVED